MAGEEIMDKSTMNSLSEGIKRKLTSFAERGAENGRHRSPASVLFFASGLLIALIACMAAENLIISQATAAKSAFAQRVKNRAPYFTAIKRSGGTRELVSANPFGTDEPEEEKSTGDLSLSDMTLRGTIPGVAAWISKGGTTSFLLLGQEAGGYRLKKITYSEVVLEAGKKQATLYMRLSGSSASGSSHSSKSTMPSVLKKAGINKEDIIPAKDGQDGSVPSELVDKLLMDPYDEMAKMRMIPAQSGGIQIARIEEDSVLGLVGVEQGDIVKSLNNIEISNLGDAANAVNSIMSGTRLDVTVIRNGKPVQLNYQVR